MSRVKSGVKKRSSRGFTILEVMIAVVVISIGFLAMMAMQVTFISGTTSARDVGTATKLGESIAEQIRAEGVMWSTLSPEFGAEARLLNTIAANARLGSYHMLRGGRPFNHISIPRGDDDGAPYLVDNSLVTGSLATLNSKFCVDAKANYLPGSNQGVLTGQIRVVWSNSGQTPWVDQTGNRCVADGGNLNQLLYFNGDTSVPNPDWNVVYVPFSIRQHSY